MELFHCCQCGNALFFENVTCLLCGSDLAFLPDRLAVAAIEPADAAPGLWRRRTRRAQGQPRLYRVCENRTDPPDTHAQ